jgi:hypothetical protein
VVGRLREWLPNGTKPGRDNSLQKCPAWPPDLFAVTATLIADSSIYATPPFTANWDETEYLFTDDYLKEVHSIAQPWAETGAVPSALQDLWQKFTRDPGLPALIQLMAIADAASAGIGFAPPSEESDSPFKIFPTIVLESLRRLAERRRTLLPHVPASLCIMISPDKLCVQPKTNTPQVGCTLRSLSHNLALLPPRGVVATSWLFMHPSEMDAGPFNI